MVRDVTMWSGMLRCPGCYGMVQDVMIWSGMLWYCPGCCGIVQDVIIWSGMLWYGPGYYCMSHEEYVAKKMSGSSLLREILETQLKYERGKEIACLK